MLGDCSIQTEVSGRRFGANALHFRTAEGSFWPELRYKGQPVPRGALAGWRNTCGVLADARCDLVRSGALLGASARVCSRGPAGECREKPSAYPVHWVNH